MPRVVTLSKVFPAYMSNAGESTNFRELYERGIKKHTIRIKGKRPYVDGQIISLRQWSGKPYCSPQEHIADVRIRVIDFVMCRFGEGNSIGTNLHVLPRVIAESDGLDYPLFLEWFSKLPKYSPTAMQMLIWNQDGPYYLTDNYIDSFIHKP